MTDRHPTTAAARPLYARRTLGLLLCCIALSPLLAASSCPSVSGLLGGSAHHGSWVANEPEGVTLMQFEPDGGMRLAMEFYNPLPMLDGMKVEMTARCERATSEREQDALLLKEPGSILLRCQDVKVERASQGLGLLLNSATSLGRIFGEHNVSSSDESVALTWSVRRDGDALILSTIDSEQASKVNTTRMEPVEAARAMSFLERFRTGTVELIDPATIPSSRRARDLP